MKRTTQAITRASDYRTLFANAFLVRVLPNRDVIISFAVDEDAHDSGASVTAQVGIGMTVSSLRLLQDLIAGALRMHELPPHGSN